MPYGRDFLDSITEILGSTRPARDIATRCSQCSNMIYSDSSARDGISWFNVDEERGDTKEMCFSCRNAKLVNPPTWSLFSDVRQWRMENDPDFDSRYE
jgi:hypothetical protein